MTVLNFDCPRKFTEILGKAFQTVKVAKGLQRDNFHRRGEKVVGDILQNVFVFLDLLNFFKAVLTLFV